MKNKLFKYAELNLTEVFQRFYDTMLSSPDMAVFFESEEQIHSLIQKQKDFLLATIRLNDAEIRTRYVELGELHHKLQIPYSDFTAAIDILEHGFIQAIVKDESSPSDLLDYTFHFFKLIRAYTAKGYLNLLLDSDIDDIENYLRNVNQSNEMDNLLATERVIWLKHVIIAIKKEDRSTAPIFKVPPELVNLINTATKNDDGLNTYALEMASRIEVTAQNIFFFIEKESYEEVLPLYRELMSIYKLTLMLTNVMAIASIATLVKESEKDPLTKLLTHHSSSSIIEKEISIANSDEYPLAFVKIDIDDLKEINDQFGYSTGDHVVQKIAEVCSSAIRSTDYAFRFGGKEFLLVLRGASINVTSIQAEIIRQKVEELNFEHQGHSFKVTASFGIEVFPPSHKNNLAVMLDVVDNKLSQAKETGRNKIVQ